MRIRSSMLPAILSALAVVAAACGGDGGTDGDDAGGAAEVRVALSEWEVLPTPDSAAAGTVAFEASNEGTQPHELVVIRTDLAPDELPVESGAVVEEGGELTAIGEIEEFEADQTRSGEFELAAGSYVLICNVPGHYEQGMRSAFTVE